MKKIVIILDGGMVQEVIADGEVEVITVDYDTETLYPEDLGRDPNGEYIYIDLPWVSVDAYKTDCFFDSAEAFYGLDG